jgi:integrase
LQWGHVNFEKRELRKVMVKTNKRHVIPLTDQAIAILRKWRERRPNSRYVFDLVQDDLDMDNDDALYNARHTFAVHALNKGLSMSVVSRLLGHGSTDITEKVYARFLPETLSAELNKLKDDFSNFAI